MNKFLKVIVCLAAVAVSGCSLLSLNHPQLFRAADIVGELPPEHSQAVVVLADGRQFQQAWIVAWEKQGVWWVNKFSAMPAVIGRSGFAAPNQKKEGDGHTPSGTFQLKRAFGYAPHVATGLDYQQATEQDFWVDDPASAQYNQWVKGTPQANSYEVLKREDKLYQYAIVIEYNTEPVVAGKGSAIFLHVWRSPQTPTAGCVAAAEKNMKKLLKWLDLSKKPIIILGDE
jgi:L,D-peptidoglycan transpeptidase YkuD (ErfK/YbiS/YcfS/YnhG family)